MENGNLEPLLEFFLNVKALGRLDVLQVDPAERRLQRLTHTNHIIGI